MNEAADRTLQVAEELERLGKKFFESFADVCKCSRIAALAASLANAEQKHISIFRQMREALPPDRQLTEKELGEATRELRGTTIPNSDTVRLALLASDFTTALEMAIAMKTWMADCYTDLAARLGGHYSAALGLLVEEEKEHVRILTEHRNRLVTQQEGHQTAPRAA
jgi:rubrerythrin